MAIATNLGFPRIGPKRELKWAMEEHWAGKLDQAALLRAAAAIRRANWQLQRRLGIDHIPSNDFSLYDHVLDTSVMVGAVPSRYGDSGGPVGLDTYFAMARGTAGKNGRASAAAMEMTKWFDTNYHYIVPEFEAGQRFHLKSTKPLDEFLEAKDLGIHTRPVLVGPVSFLLLGKARDGATYPLSLLDGLLPIYEELLRRLAEAGADWVQVDEPCLGLTLDGEARAAFGRAYRRLATASPVLKLLVAVYFSGPRDNLDVATGLPVAALHVDAVRGTEDLSTVIPKLPDTMALSVGVIDGRNVWKTDLNATLDVLEPAAAALGGDRLLVGPSCSLLHSPVDLQLEAGLDEEMSSWFAFATQKVAEVATLTRALNNGRDSEAAALSENARAMEGRRTSSRIHNPSVLARAAGVEASMLRRDSPHAVRKEAQQEAMPLPAFPTTTIGSFPQTAEVRRARAALRRGAWSAEQYETFLKEEIAQAVRFQEEVGLDLLVHGEPERNDMVEYFGELLAGFVSTANGWVQSYGSRCVKPPVIYGDVTRLKPMTVEWITYAQSLTDRPVKGMLTGPVTMLQWSFVRDDQPRGETCKQLALAVRDEVADLESAGIRVIQIDEPAFREGLPLHQEEWPEYLRWAVECFRLASSGVADATQVHTHMCYSEFNDIIEAIADLDADVISIESSRSNMELLEAFARYRYPNDIGPGVYDIHSPRIAATGEMEDLLRKALGVLSRGQLWVNPDCGLKTRRWDEVKPSLQHMVEAAKALR